MLKIGWRLKRPMTALAARGSEMSAFTTVTFAGTDAGVPFTGVWTFDYPLHPFEVDYAAISQTDVLTAAITFDHQTMDFSAGFILQGHESGGTGSEIYAVADRPDGAAVSILVIDPARFFYQPFDSLYTYANSNHTPTEGSLRLCLQCSDISLSIDTVTQFHVPAAVVGEGLAPIAALLLGWVCLQALKKWLTKAS